MMRGARRWALGASRGIAKVGRRVYRFFVRRDTVRVITEAVAGGCFTWAGWQFDEKAGAIVLGLVFLNWAYSPGTRPRS